jgi:hypothetical protein
MSTSRIPQSWIPWRGVSLSALCRGTFWHKFMPISHSGLTDFELALALLACAFFRRL